MLNRFIEAFKDIVCAPTETQMRALWTSMIEEGSWPRESIEYLRRQYYDSSKAHQFMECYVFDAVNLHQTITSRNEGAYHALRSNASILSKLSTSYLLRRQHNTIWMKCLCGNAIRSANHIDLDIDIVPELHEIKKKISLFALRE